MAVGGGPLRPGEEDNFPDAVASPVSGEVEFDRIAPVYDETRRAPSEEETAALADLLEGCRTVLDAGVGTGRFAVPLHARRFEIVGVDLSLEMMRRARAKGISDLVRADLRRLPLSDRAVDAAFMAHVLQLLPDPRGVLAELGRVARRAVVVQLPEWPDRPPTEAWRSRRQRYREIAAELGHPLPERRPRYRHTLEELSEIAPPTTVREVPGQAPGLRRPGEGRPRWDPAWFGVSIPPEVHAEIVRRLEAEHPVDASAGPRPRSTRFLLWNPLRLRVPQ